MKLNIFRQSGEDQKIFVRQLFKTIKNLKNLERLNLQVEVCSETIQLVNQNLNKESNLKELSILFVDKTTKELNTELFGQGRSGFKKDTKLIAAQKFDIKFPRYLKHLRKMKLRGICDPNFTETLFDMAS